jgi:hypothetical protein
MLIDTRPNLYGRQGTDPCSKLYWLNIELSISNILFRQRVIQNNILGHPRPMALQYCVLHGIGVVANALTVGEKGQILIISWSISFRSCKTKKIILKPVRPPG